MMNKHIHKGPTLQILSCIDEGDWGVERECVKIQTDKEASVVIKILLGTDLPLS